MLCLGFRIAAKMLLLYLFTSLKSLSGWRVPPPRPMPGPPGPGTPAWLSLAILVANLWTGPPKRELAPCPSASPPLIIKECVNEFVEITALKDGRLQQEQENAFLRARVGQVRREGVLGAAAGVVAGLLPSVALALCGKRRSAGTKKKGGRKPTTSTKSSDSSDVGTDILSARARARALPG